MNCPCEDCLCVPICRHKGYFKLMNDCSLINKYTSSYDNKHLRVADKILQSTQWRINKKNNVVLILTLDPRRD